jgi:hypothetical protein
MNEQLSRMELKAIAGFLRKVYPGVTEQDTLWNLIAKVEQLAKGNNGKPGRRRGDSSQGA